MFLNCLRRGRPNLAGPSVFRADLVQHTRCADVVKMWPVWCSPGAKVVQHTRCADVVKMWPVWCSPGAELMKMCKGSAKVLPFIIYVCFHVIRSAKYHSFIESVIFHRFIVSAKYHRFFTLKRAKTAYFVKKHENFSRKTKIFPFFLASFKNSLYLCNVKLKV